MRACSAPVAVLLGMTLLTLAIGQAQAAAAGNTRGPSSPTKVIEPPILWAHAYGNDDLFAADVIQTSDGNFAVTGQYQFFSPDGADIYLLKVGANGLKLGQTFDDYGAFRFYGGSFIEQTEDLGFIVAGSGSKLIPPSSFFYLAKYDASGNKLWSKEYKPEGSDAMCLAATATPDGGYLMVGSMVASASVDYVYVVKADGLGHTEWDSIISNPAGLGDTSAIARSVTLAPGGYALTGEVYDQNTGLTSAFLLRLNVFGKVVAREHYNFRLPYSTKTDIDGRSIQYTKDGFIIAGSAYGYNSPPSLTPRAAFLLKVATSGNVRWFKTYGRSAGSSASSVCETRDGGYILTGNTDWTTVSSSFHAYVARTDSNGNQLWTKTITSGGMVPYATSAGNKIIVTSDGGYIMAGMAVPGAAADTLLVRIEPDIVSGKSH